MKRFWKTVDVREHAGGWQVTLDGRGVKTQKGGPQVVPGRALAEALAAEWAAQGEEIDPAGFALRDLADYALDVVAADKAAVAETVLGYAETDTLCYRGDPGEALTAWQESEWDPVLARMEARHGIAFARVAGIIHRPQPADTLAVLERRLAELSPLRLAALQTLTSLSASLVVGLEALEPGADLTHLWNVANLEEDWQAELWGRDAEAEARRERRRAAFMAAAEFAALALAPSDR